LTTPLGVNTYPLRYEAMSDFDATLRRVADIGFLGIETIGLPDMPSLHAMPPAKFRALIDELDLELIATHVEPLGERNRKVAEQELAVHAEIGTPAVILSLGSAEYFESSDSLERALDGLAGFAEKATGYGMKVGYHNHWWEYSTEFNGRKAISVILERLDSAFVEADIYWLQTAGLNVAPILEELGDELRILHLKDGPCTVADPQTAVGSGLVDIPAAVRAATAADWHIAELDDCDGDMFEALEKSFHFLTEEGLSRGRIREVDAT